MIELALVVAALSGVQALSEPDRDYLAERCGIVGRDTALSENQSACLDVVTAELLGEDRSFLELEDPEIEAWHSGLYCDHCDDPNQLPHRVEFQWPVDRAGDLIVIGQPIQVEVVFDITADGSTANVEVRALEPAPQQAAFEEAIRRYVEELRYTNPQPVQGQVARFVFDTTD